MRDIFLVLATAAGLGVGLAWPYAGALLWTWFSLMTPQAETFGFARTLPLNMIVAAIATLRWVLSKEPKLPANDLLIWLAVLFLGWCAINGLVAVDPDWSATYWDRAWKIFALGFLLAVETRTKARIHALVWVIVTSLLYYGVKGGLFTILSGGGSHVYGPDGTIIADNNQLALALLMALPLANYLRSQSANKWISRLLLASMMLTVVAVLGTYSRGGFIGLALLAIAGLLQFKHKTRFVFVVLLVLVPVLYLMPDAFFARLHSINDYDSDASFQGRVIAWHVAFDYARDHFPFGAGFYAPQLAEVFHTYYPDEKLRAAHSIYFQVLGEQGFVGLALYLALLATAFLKSFGLARAIKGNPEHKAMGELLKMIQLALLVFCVSGAALSMAYYDLFLIYLAMLVAMRWQVSLTTAAWPARRMMAAPLAAE